MSENLSGIYPLEYKVLVKPDITRTETEGGIALPPDTIQKEQQAQTNGILLAAGSLAFEGWDVTPKIGRKVYFAKYAGIYLDGEDGEQYRLMNDKDVMAVRK